MQRLFFEIECSCDPRGVANPDKKWMNSERGERARDVSVVAQQHVLMYSMTHRAQAQCGAMFPLRRIMKRSVRVVYLF